MAALWEQGYNRLRNRDSTNWREAVLLFWVTLFLLVNGVSLLLVHPEDEWWVHLWAPASWIVLIWAVHLLFVNYLPSRDPILWPIVAFLSGWGILLIDRLAVNFLGKQMVWLFLSVGGMLFFSLKIDNLSWLRRYRYSWFSLGLMLLLGTLLFGVNPSGFGARLWLQVPFLNTVYFQPSELLKLLLIVLLASYFDERIHFLKLMPDSGRFATSVYLFPMFLMWGFSMVVLVWQRDLGAASLFFMLFVGLLYLVTGDIYYVFGGMLLLFIAAVVGYVTFEVVALRIDAWINPWPDASNRSFQIVQSLYAIASGGVWGQGIGQGVPTYIPVVHSDFVFAAIAEEWGLIGSLTTLTTFFLLIQRSIRLAMVSNGYFQNYLAAGIGMVFGLQSFLIMGGVTKLLPLTGVTLPFVSYGGSSLFISFIMVGLLIFMSSQTDF